jgi:hypothetical protein
LTPGLGPSRARKLLQDFGASLTALESKRLPVEVARQSTHASHSAPRRRNWRKCEPRAVISSLGTNRTVLSALVRSTNHTPPVCPRKCLTSQPSNNFRGRLASSNPLRESNQSEAGDGLGQLRPVSAGGVDSCAHEGALSSERLEGAWAVVSTWFILRRTRKFSRR